MKTLMANTNSLPSPARKNTTTNSVAESNGGSANGIFEMVARIAEGLDEENFQP